MFSRFRFTEKSAYSAICVFRPINPFLKRKTGLERGNFEVAGHIGCARIGVAHPRTSYVASKNALPQPPGVQFGLTFVRFHSSQATYIRRVWGGSPQPVTEASAKMYEYVRRKRPGGSILNGAHRTIYTDITRTRQID